MKKTPATKKEKNKTSPEEASTDKLQDKDIRNAADTDVREGDIIYDPDDPTGLKTQIKGQVKKE